VAPDGGSSSAKVGFAFAVLAGVEDVKDEVFEGVCAGVFEGAGGLRVAEAACESVDDGLAVGFVEGDVLAGGAGSGSGGGAGDGLAVVVADGAGDGLTEVTGAVDVGAAAEAPSPSFLTGKKSASLSISGDVVSIVTFCWYFLSSASSFFLSSSGVIVTLAFTTPNSPEVNTPASTLETTLSTFLLTTICFDICASCAAAIEITRGGGSFE
jgi:hypothetical protein